MAKRASTSTNHEVPEGCPTEEAVGRAIKAILTDEGATSPDRGLPSFDVLEGLVNEFGKECEESMAGQLRRIRLNDPEIEMDDEGNLSLKLSRSVARRASARRPFAAPARKAAAGRTSTNSPAKASVRKPNTAAPKPKKAGKLTTKPKPTTKSKARKGASPRKTP